MPASSKTTKALPGLRITQRDRDLCLALYEGYHRLTHRQLAALFWPHAGSLDSRAVTRRLATLVRHEVLVARRMPTDGPAGRPPLVYSLGPAGAALVCRTRSLSLDHVRRRARADRRREWFRWEHERAIADVRIAITRACQARGFGLRWLSDEELAARHETVLVDGRLQPWQPDGLFVIAMPRPEQPPQRAAYALEVQVASSPGVYREKAIVAATLFTSGEYQRQFGLGSLRVLAVGDTTTRARHLQRAVEGDARHEAVAPLALFWSTALADLVADPFGPVWWVAGAGDTRYALV